MSSAAFSILIMNVLILLIFIAMVWEIIQIIRGKRFSSAPRVQSFVQEEKRPASKIEISIEAVVSIAIWTVTVVLFVTLYQEAVGTSIAGRKFSFVIVGALFALPSIYITWWRNKLPYPRSYILSMWFIYALFDLLLFATRFV